MSGHARRHFAVSCAKIAEPTDFPFGLWTRVAEESTRSIVFVRLRQCALMTGTFAQTGEFDCTVRLPRRCGPMSNYLDHLSVLLTTLANADK